MRLDQITWTRHNKNSERSQLLWRGEQMYVLIRTHIVAMDGTTSAHYALYKDGSIFEQRDADPTVILENLWPHKMTPLELKCWKMEQWR